MNKAGVDIKTPVPFLLDFSYGVMQFFPETCKNFVLCMAKHMTMNPES
jgi:hypothetical protein